MVIFPAGGDVMDPIKKLLLEAAQEFVAAKGADISSFAIVVVDSDSEVLLAHDGGGLEIVGALAVAQSSVMQDINESFEEGEESNS